jgi:galactose mutarotase-like enzyme
VYNAVPGRYANRIGNGTYTIGNTTYHTEQNDGNNTLHSGTNNWSYRFWNVTDYTNSSISFGLLDASNSSQGLFGRVQANVTYSVTPNTWHIHITAESLDQKTREHPLHSLSLVCSFPDD